MSKRGKGRGRGISFAPEQIGLTVRDFIPSSILGPPKLYPPLSKRPLPLSSDPIYEELCKIKKDFDSDPLSSCMHLTSKKYLSWSPDWDYFPHELRPNRHKKKKLVIAPKPKVANLDKHIEELERKEAEDSVQPKADEKQAEKKDKDNEEEVDSDSSAPPEEEDNDYIQSYFDNGEEDALSDDNLEDDNTF